MPKIGLPRYSIFIHLGIPPVAACPAWRAPFLLSSSRVMRVEQRVLCLAYLQYTLSTLFRVDTGIGWGVGVRWGEEQGMFDWLYLWGRCGYGFLRYLMLSGGVDFFFPSVLFV